jgi:hypothetical protein
MGAPLDPIAAAGYGAFVDAAYAMFEADRDNPTPAPLAIPATHDFVAWVQMNDFLPGSAPLTFYGILAQSKTTPNAFVLAIRGTDDWTEWFDNLHFGLVPFAQVPAAGRVANGFDTIYSTLNVVDAPAAGAAAATAPNGASAAHAAVAGSFAQQVETIVARHVPALPADAHGIAPLPSADMVVVGHSLGAALGTLYVLDNAANAQLTNPLLCTFGSPRVGDPAFVQRFNALGLTAWRVANAPDLVTMVPPPILGYDHVDTLCGVDSRGVVTSSLPCFHAMSTYEHMLDASYPGSAACPASALDQTVAAPLAAHALFAASSAAAPAPAVTAKVAPIAVVVEDKTTTIAITVNLYTT